MVDVRMMGIRSNRVRALVAQRAASSDWSRNRKLPEGDAGCDSLTFMAHSSTRMPGALEGLGNGNRGSAER